ncbi:MAG TPA: tRNA (adenosine(37)-N6)-threonylcarbamoyltransferase complex dimerization subunit type 1 TsaB [Oculatellaceae cyanobacterium]|jgi:tRNA threonylcarbamoyl adenosine modification protein YeaZ
MSRILHIDTTTSRLMLGLSDGDVMISRFTAPCDSHRYHSAILTPAIRDLLAESGTSVRDLSGLAVNLGPGSFTGIRTGIITVRTMAQFLNLPLYGINTFEILALGRTRPLAIYLDALRLRSYHAVLHYGEDGPVYSQEPCLQMLSSEGNMPPEGADLLTSPTLAPLFPSQHAEQIGEDFYPDAMLDLIQSYGPFFKQPWQEVKPLYLQAPSITLKKTVTPRLE